MEDTRITFETAKLAKEKGFIPSQGTNCTSYLSDGRTGYENIWNFDKDIPNIDEHILSVTQSLIAKWLREKHNLHLIAYKNINIDGYDWCYITTDGITNINSYKTYEEALEAGLQEALKLIK